MRKSAKTVLDRITDKIRREYKPEKIILFGSCAYGEPARDSDSVG
ncbi:MAG: nucleotidyltransferase domain-containing protein [Elusimicrobia bacterium]|nr:nucleotidyltransferase domain-containing protein [Elusimicrobiota bacterium]